MKAVVYHGKGDIRLEEIPVPEPAPGELLVLSCDWNFRPDHCHYQSTCRTAEQSGVGIVGTSGLLGNYSPAAWTHYSGSFTAPAGTDFLSIQFMANTGAVTGSVSTMYIDNVSLVQPGVIPTQETTWGGIKDLYR